MKCLAMIAAALGLALAVASCGEDDDHDEPVGTPTESVCPSGSSLTYDTFGRTFVETYCTRCHSSTLVGAARNGAPEFHDFDTLLGIQMVADHVDQKAAAGPAATNVAMPPDGATPTLSERQQLGEWIACGAP
jgi:uncharacterized membrane protein